MNENQLNEKMAELSKTIFSYCINKTSNREDAEDLSQDIIYELIKSSDNLRDDNAFYGFMWGVANNVYKQWYRKKLKRNTYELTDDVPDISEYCDMNDTSSKIYLLRRELTLLSEKYRRAAILYYIDLKSCSEISEILSISESMVKYLLFKSRKILKEGMNMERNYGEQSYNPKGLNLLFWGNNSNNYNHLCDSKISQNILFACYNDKLTAEQISLEIGVALPYMEDKLSELLEYELLKKDGNKYYTNIVIFTKDFTKEVNIKTSELKEKIANALWNSISVKEKKVRDIGFVGADMSPNSFSWQMVCFILYHAIINDLQSRIEIEFPKDKFGVERYVWGVEKSDIGYWSPQFSFGISNVRNQNDDYVQFMDFPINGKMVHHYFYNYSNTSNIFLDIANHNTEHFSENDKAIVADMSRKGYVISNEKGLFVNTPVFTREQYDKLNSIFEEDTKEIADEAEKLMEVVTGILKNHMPIHLKNIAKDMAYFRLFEDAISAPVSILFDRKYLFPYNEEGYLPTTYVILK